MGKVRHKGKNRRDKYYRLAKEQGYRARSAFKLIQLNKKYDILSNVAARHMPHSSTIIGLDLDPIKPIRGVKTFVEDITTAKCRATLKRELQGKPADVVLHDGAPNVGQAWAKDAFGQSELTLHALKLATEYLRKGGTFVTKVFRSADYASLMWVFQRLFAKVEATKPLSSRNSSAEIFVVCQKYVAPDKLDARMLDPKHVFAMVRGPGPVMDVMHSKNTQRRHREGYADDAGVLLFRSASVSEFLAAEEPVRILSECSEIRWDVETEDLKAWEGTPQDVLFAMQDLKVLTKKDFKELLRWRSRAAKHVTERRKLAAEQAARELASEEPQAPAGSDGESSDAGSDAGAAEDEEAGLDKELAKFKERELQRKRRELKKLRQQKQKERVRKALGMNQTSVDVVQHDDEVFGVDVLGGRVDALDQVREGAAAGLESDSDEEGGADDGAGHPPLPSGSAFGGRGGGVEEEAEDSDLEQEREEDMNRALEEAYSEFRRRKSKRESDYVTTLEGKKGAKVRRKLEMVRLGGMFTDEMVGDKADVDVKYTEMLERKGVDEDEDSSDDDDNDDDDDSDDDDDADGDDDDDDDDDDGGERQGGSDGSLLRRRRGTGIAPAPRKARVENPLLATVVRSAKADEREQAERWFSHPLFAGVEEELEAAEQQRERGVAAAADSDDEDEEGEEELDEEDEEDNDSSDDDGDDDGGAPLKRRRLPIGELPKSDREVRKEKRRKVRERQERRTAHRDQRDSAGFEIVSAAAKAARAAADLAGKSRVGPAAEVAVELKDDATRKLLREGAGRAAEDEEGYASALGGGGGGSLTAKERKVGFATVPASAPGREAGAAEREYAAELERLEKARPGTQEHAELLALGTMMLRDSTAREVMDSAYNRFAFPEDEGELPLWFADDENKFNKPQLPVTAEMVARIRQRYQDLTAKPIKKVAEARDRKRKRAQAKVAKIKAQMANAMEDETTERSKLRAMQKAISGANLKRPGKAYAVATKAGVNQKGNAKYAAVVVDRRLKSDKRGMKRAAKRKKGFGKKKK